MAQLVKYTLYLRPITRDVQLLCSLSWKYDDIYKFTGFEISQIRYACSHPATLKKNPSRPPVLS